MTLLGTVIAFDFLVEVRCDLLRHEFGAIFTARLRKCFTRRVSVEPKTETSITPGSPKGSQMKTFSQLSYWLGGVGGGLLEFYCGPAFWVGADLRGAFAAPPSAFSARKWWGT